MLSINSKILDFINILETQKTYVSTTNLSNKALKLPF